MKKAVLLIHLTIFFIFISVLYSEAKELTIVYTASSNGKLRSCGCPGDPYGGLSERVTLIKDLRKREKTFMLVDAGNMVSLFGEYELRSQCVLNIMNLMKYDVAAAGRHEMYSGINDALNMTGTAEFPIISASFVRSPDLSFVFNPYKTFKVGKSNVTVTALCDSSTGYIQTGFLEFDYEVLPPSVILKSVLSDVSKESDFIVVLSQMDLKTNKKILKDFPAIDLIVQEYGNTQFDPPVQLKKGVIVAPGSKGNFVGLITLKKSKGEIEIKRSELIPVLNIIEDKKASKIIHDYYKKLE